MLAIFVMLVAMTDSIAQQDQDYANRRQAAEAILASGTTDTRQLMASLTQFYIGTPEHVAADAWQYLEHENTTVRALAYQLQINAGKAERVRDKLRQQVDELEYAEGGERQMVYALAAIEKPDLFAARMESNRLVSSTVRNATVFNRFVWADDATKETMLKDMLTHGSSENEAAAIFYLLENNRTDALRKYGIAYPYVSPLERYDKYITGFSRMTREQQLQFLSPAELDPLIEASKNPGTPKVSGIARNILNQTGYRIEQDGDRLIVVAPE